MNAVNLPPKEIINLSSEHFLSSYSRTSKIIYLLVMLATIVALAALPFLWVDISVKSSGLLKATAELNIIKANAAGYVNEVFIKENAAVRKGQLLLALHSPLLEEKERYLQKRIAETSEFLLDAQQLLNSNYQPTTNIYRQSLSDYQQKLSDKQTRFEKVKQDYDRNKKLYDQQVIAAAEFENYKFEYDKAKGDIELLKQAQLSTWQQELRGHQKEKIEFENQLAQLTKEKESLNIRASISGNIQNMAGIYAGSMVFANQELAQISPDTSLVVECYISPNDIGLLQPNMPVRFQVDAFNYNQWGIATGKVLEISNDIHVINNKPIFKVKCKMDQEFLQLKNGYKGYLKKGMTMQARFIVTKRTLWQLLYDKADDWLNPNAQAIVLSP